MTQKHSSGLKLSLRLLRESRDHWRNLALILMLGLLATPIALLLPYPLKVAVDSVIGDKALPFELKINPTSTLIFVCFLSFVILLAQALQGYAIWIYQLYAGEKLVLEARTKLFRHVQKLSLLKHDERGAPDLLYRLQNDVFNMQHIAIYGLIPFCTSAVMFVTMFIITVRLDWQLALIAIGILPILFTLSRLHAQKSRALWAAAKETERSAIAVLQEGLSCIRVVKAFAQEDREANRFREKAESNLKRYLEVLGTETLYGMWVAAAIGLATSSALFLGIYHVRSGLLSLGDFLIVIAYLAQLLKPLETFSKQAASTQASLASAERVYALADEVPDIADSPTASSLDRARGAVAFENVSFAYSGGRRGLRQVSFRVEAGQRVGIIGPTGAGKTTLINLLVRFFDPSEGRITLDGKDLREIRLSDLRNQFAPVLQEPVLFSGSILDNITYARPNATYSEVIGAARAADAHGFITALPEGYETKVGERGMSLSGGERQRISLARAFLMDAPILVLDEPTSSVDLAKESTIAAALTRLQKGRTTFTITHRLSLIENYDLILEIRDGQLAQTQVPRSEFSNAQTLSPGVS